MSLADLKPGDECWQINGTRNRAFLCRVVRTSAADETILVENIDKGVRQLFNFDGTPVDTVYRLRDDIPVEKPILVPIDDEDAIKLEEQGAERQLRARISGIVRYLPNPEAIDKIKQELDEWQAR